MLELIAGPPSRSRPWRPVPAKVEIVPSGVTLRTREFSFSAM
jgi:hypothetical protein